MRAGSAVLLLLGMLLAGEAYATDAMRCGSKLVSTGDRGFDVLRKCGEPSYRDGWDEYLAYYLAPTAHVEEWYYNYGPSRLVHVLRIRNGVVTDIDTDGYGHYEDSGGPCNPYEIVFGMTQYELIARCGEPDARERRLEYRSFRRRDDRYSYPVTVRVDEWIYNFGPANFIRIVTLVNGRVDEVELGERGY